MKFFRSLIKLLRGLIVGPQLNRLNLLNMHYIESIIAVANSASLPFDIVSDSDTVKPTMADALLHKLEALRLENAALSERIVVLERLSKK